MFDSPRLDRRISAMPYADSEQKRRSQRERVTRRRFEWFSGKSCIRCGSNEDLRLDHIDPSTKIDHKVWSWSQERRDAELAKCQVLCQPCHIWKTVSCEESVFRGQDNGRTKLDETTVLTIRRLYVTGEVTQRQLAAHYGVSLPTINELLCGKTWAWL